MLSFIVSRISHLPSLGMAVLTGTLSIASLAAETTLSIERAQQLAVEQSRQLDAQNFAIQASREMSVAARQLPDPVVSVGVDNLPINGAERLQLGSDFMTMRRIGVMQEFTRSSKRELRGKRFELEAEQIAAEKHAVLAAVERQAALAWLNRYYAEAAAAMIEAQERQAGQELGAAESAYQTGRRSQTDVIAARIALAEIGNRASEIARKIESAKILLTRWVGDAASLPLSDKPKLSALRFEADTLQSHLTHHPEIAVLARQEQVAASEARLAEAETKADWSLQLMYSQRGAQYSDMVSVGISIPLQWNQHNRQDREVAAKLARVEQVRAEKEDMWRVHFAETTSMIREWQEMNQRLDRYAKELIPLASQRTESLIVSYSGGKASLHEVLSARRSEIDMRLQALALEHETAQLWAHLNYLFPTSSVLPASRLSVNQDIK